MIGKQRRVDEQLRSNEGQGELRHRRPVGNAVVTSYPILLGLAANQTTDLIVAHRRSGHSCQELIEQRLPIGQESERVRAPVKQLRSERDGHKLVCVLDEKRPVDRRVRFE
jgi:hypothetical protein